MESLTRYDHQQANQPRPYLSPKLTPKHATKIKQSKRRPKVGGNSNPRLDFPPPPSYPPPEHYNLSDEYSADADENRFRSEGFWNSPNFCFVPQITDLDEPADEEIRLINQLREEGALRDEENGGFHFRSEIWVGASPDQIVSANEAQIQTTKNHISNVLITHGNEEVIENFVETKPINGDPNNMRLPKRPDSPDEYSYAYYEPGPARVVSRARQKPAVIMDRNARHTYTTRYGTEENIYEEITEVGMNLRNRFHQQVQRERMEKLKKIHLGETSTPKKKKSSSEMSLHQSLLAEEVREVQSTHRRVLGQLNLTMEAMLMPTGKEKEEVEEEMEREPEVETRVVDVDSGFSGSSGTSASLYGGSQYGPQRSPFRRPDAPRSSLPLRGKNEGEYSCCSSNSNGLCLDNINEKDWNAETLAGFGLHRVYQNQGAVKSQSFPRGATTPNCKRLDGGKQPKLSSSWAKRGWRRLAGFATGSSNKVNVLDEPHTKSGWENGHHGPHGRASSEDSWFSGSDNELSSGDESSERSATSSTRSNGQLRQTLNKAKALWSQRHGHHHASAMAGRETLPSAATASNLSLPPGAHPTDAGQPGRLARWLSIRRGGSNQYELDNGGMADRLQGKMPLLSEVEEENVVPGSLSTSRRRTAPPTLPPAPASLTPQQLKRRHIVAAIVHSENSYISTLQRLVNDYKKPLEESSPAILSRNKIATLFKKLPEILQCHNIFRIALAEAIRTWDRDERIGEVFVGSFSKNIVLDIYSGFINNFSAAMDLAKTEAKRKSALSDFFQVKQMSSPDRLSFFALMVKPVQRFPQFILFLQDLLKHTPHGHHDRMNLQHALTQLESLAEMLNERKREAEQCQAFKEMLRHVSAKFATRPLSDANRCLLREDDVVQLEFNSTGGVAKTKPRRLLLLNDLLLCVAVSAQSVPTQGPTASSMPRLSLKWTHPVSDIEVLDTSQSPTLSRLLTSSVHRAGSLKRDSSEPSPIMNAQQPSGNTAVDSICQEMADLMHDYEVLSRIGELASTLKGNYPALSTDSLRTQLNEIQQAIQVKDEAMSWVDSCCLQITLKNSKSGKEETVTFQTMNPQVKKEWTTELRLAQLALDANNSPAWEVPDEEQRPSTKMPLFVKSQCVYSSPHQTEVRCGCFYSVSSPKSLNRRSRQQNYLWACSTDGVSSHITILLQSGHLASQLRNILSFDLTEVMITCLEHVKSAPSDEIWLGTDSGRIFIYSANEPEKGLLLNSLQLPAGIGQIRYHGDNVFVALHNGQIVLYQRHLDGSVMVQEGTERLIGLGTEPVACLLAINATLYAACGKTVAVLCAYTGDIQKSFAVQHDQQPSSIALMAHSGVGLWIALKHSSTICLYHMETFRHLQDINIASNVLRIMQTQQDHRPLVYVTALMACKGLLWVGTNVGVCLTIPLPRLEGVPIISGRFNIAYHAHFGPVGMLLALVPRSSANVPAKVENRTKMEKSQTLSDKIKHQLVVSPVMLRRKTKPSSGACSDSSRRLSKTLPRGGSTSSSQGSADRCDVYGLYGELMNCRDVIDCDTVDRTGSTVSPAETPLRRNSDPDLATKLSTLDRRLRMRSGRPRSLDLSSWSVESHASSLYTSSGSEESVVVKGRGMKRAESTGALPTTVERNNEQKVVEAKEEKKGGKGAGHNANGVADGGRRTVITLMGGKGYVNWRQTCCAPTGGKSGNHLGVIKPPNSHDAHLVIWEMKL